MNSIKISRTPHHSYFIYADYQSIVMKKLLYNHDLTYITLKDVKSDLMDIGIGYQNFGGKKKTIIHCGSWIRTPI